LNLQVYSVTYLFPPLCVDKKINWVKIDFARVKVVYKSRHEKKIHAGMCQKKKSYL